jgi:hypothetical protein
MYDISCIWSGYVRNMSLEDWASMGLYSPQYVGMNLFTFQVSRSMKSLVIWDIFNMLTSCTLETNEQRNDGAISQLDRMLKFLTFTSMLPLTAALQENGMFRHTHFIQIWPMPSYFFSRRHFLATSCHSWISLSITQYLPSMKPLANSAFSHANASGEASSQVYGILRSWHCNPPNPEQES